MNQLIIHFGKTLQQLRKRKGWSQEDLAEHANLNRSYIGELERGHAVASLITLEKLAIALELSLSLLLLHTELVSTSNSPGGIKLAGIAC